MLSSSDRTHSLRYYQTGTAPLDQLTNTIVNASLELVLPLTVGLLLVISMAYFRSPLTPLATFAGLGVALTLALGGTILLGRLFGPVDTTSLTLEEVFVLGVGTDYSIFLVARYREELHRGRSSDEAIEQSLAWAGQSVATSGSTAIIATLALTFSGVALLSQWGRVLSFAILITILLSLTLVPAFLKLIGPRIFWPDSGRGSSSGRAGPNARIRGGKHVLLPGGAPHPTAAARRPRSPAPRQRPAGPPRPRGSPRVRFLRTAAERPPRFRRAERARTRTTAAASRHPRSRW